MTLRVTMISESEFGMQNQGVHTAHREMIAGLKAIGVAVSVNSWRAPADITHIQTVGLYSLFFLLFGRGKKVVSAHVVPASFVGSLAGVKYWLPIARWYLKWFYGRADVVCAVSSMVRDELVTGMGLNNRVEVTYNTIDMSQYQVNEEKKQRARQTLKLASDEFVVLGVGQVQPRKRVDRFVEVAAQSDASFVWVGGINFRRLGAAYDEMTELMKTTRPNVRMPGIIDHDQIALYYAAADAFYLPAEQENHPMCVLEAAGTGLPIVLNDIPEYNDTFRPDAIFVNTADQALQALHRLRDDKTYYQIEQAASANIAARFDNTTGARRLEQIYHSLIER